MPQQIKSGSRAKDEIVASLLDQIKTKDEQLEIIIEQLRSKDNQIASLEEKLVGMSLELATSKAMEDFHDHRSKQLEYEKKKTTPRRQYQRVSSLLSQESVERGGALAQSLQLSRRQPREPAQQRFSRSLNSLFSSMNPVRNNDKTSNIIGDDPADPTESSSLHSSLHSFGSQNQPADTQQRQQAVESSNGGVVILASKEERKNSLGTSNVIDWD